MSEAKWMSLYEYKGIAYRVVYFTEMKCPHTGEWYEAVLYQIANSGKIYCREKKDFEKKFKQV